MAVVRHETGRIRKGDTVIVLTGKNKGKQGQVIRVVPKKDRVVVERVNMIKRHTRPSQKSQGGIVEKEAPIHLSNVAIVCPACKKAVRIGFKFHEDGTKVRYCRSCSEELDK
ncbi:MAG TPA: 50S ribosomal protein L24 [Deltaproteobacteria bacterium]|nr:50S ribosomal protein L24 [Deltaproteobacteria bacterium]HOM29603.1 50S ribosomal protein L24 [Deltaproteobacteria bacterium]HPP81287.1 50S ribosomal protein L24 [Deltaproteobacteria bacterium]